MPCIEVNHGRSKKNISPVTRHKITCGYKYIAGRQYRHIRGVLRLKCVHNEESLDKNLDQAAGTS